MSSAAFMLNNPGPFQTAQDMQTVSLAAPVAGAALLVRSAVFALEATARAPGAFTLRAALARPAAVG